MSTRKEIRQGFTCAADVFDALVGKMENERARIGVANFELEGHPVFICFAVEDAATKMQLLYDAEFDNDPTVN